MIQQYLPSIPLTCLKLKTKCGYKSLYQVIKTRVKKTLNYHNKKGDVVIITKEQLNKFVIDTINSIECRGLNHCDLCGNPMMWSILEGDLDSQDYRCATLDRIDTGNKLSIENIQWICRRCNMAKGTQTIDELKNYIMSFAINNDFEIIRDDGEVILKTKIENAHGELDANNKICGGIYINTNRMCRYVNGRD
jgi:5-methylcytosine-specific restriction endonuclease McrA